MTLKRERETDRSAPLSVLTLRYQEINNYITVFRKLIHQENSPEGQLSRTPFKWQLSNRGSPPTTVSIKNKILERENIVIAYWSLNNY